MPTPITAAMLYALIACLHRVMMDLYSDPAGQNEPSPFVEPLWRHGTLYEREAISRLEIPFADLSQYAGEEKERRTITRLKRWPGISGFAGAIRTSRARHRLNGSTNGSRPAIRQRILEYNEDDCKATRVLKDAIGKPPLSHDSVPVDS